MDFIDALDDELLCSFVATRAMALSEGEAHACSSAPLRVQRAQPGSTAIRDFLTSQDSPVLQLPRRDLAELHSLHWSLVELLVDHAVAEEASPLDRVVLHAEVLKRVMIAKRRLEVQVRDQKRAPPAAHCRRRSTVTAAFGKRVSILDAGVVAEDQSTDEALSMDDFQRSAALADSTNEDPSLAGGGGDPHEHSGQADPFTLSRIGVDVPRRNSHMFGTSLSPSGQPTPQHHQAETLSKSLGIDAGRIRDAMRAARKNSHSRDAAAAVMVDPTKTHVVGLMPHVVLRASDRPACSRGAFGGSPDALASLNGSPTAAGVLHHRQQPPSSTPTHTKSGSSPLATGAVIPAPSPRVDVGGGSASPRQPSPPGQAVLGEPALDVDNEQHQQHQQHVDSGGAPDPFKSPPRSGIAVNTELSRNVHRFPMPPPRLPRDDAAACDNTAGGRLDTDPSFDADELRHERTRESYTKVESRVSEPEAERAARLKRESARRERARADVSHTRGGGDATFGGATFSVRGTWSASGSPRIANVEHPSARESGPQEPLTLSEGIASAPPHAASSTLRLEPSNPVSRPADAATDRSDQRQGSAALSATSGVQGHVGRPVPTLSRPAWSASRQERRFELAPPGASQDHDGRAIDMITRRKDFVFKRCRVSTQLGEAPSALHDGDGDAVRSDDVDDGREASTSRCHTPQAADTPVWTAEQADCAAAAAPAEEQPRMEEQTTGALAVPPAAATQRPRSAEANSEKVLTPPRAPPAGPKGRFRTATGQGRTAVQMPKHAANHTRRPLAAPSQQAREKTTPVRSCAAGTQRCTSARGTPHTAAACTSSPKTTTTPLHSPASPLSPSKPPTPKRAATDAPVRLPSADRRSRPGSSGPRYRTALIPAEMLGFATQAAPQGGTTLHRRTAAAGGVTAAAHGCVTSSQPPAATAVARASSAPTSRPARAMAAGQRPAVPAVAEDHTLKSAGRSLWPRRAIHSAGARVSGPPAFMHDMDSVRRSIRRAVDDERVIENATPDASFFSDGSPLNLDMEPALVCGESSASGGGAALSSVMRDRRADGGAAHSMASAEAASLHSTVLAWNRAAMGLMRVQ